MTTSKLDQLISPAFYEVHRDIRAHAYDEYVLKGGRGSTKSSFVSVEVILAMLKHPEMHAVVLRKVANTLRTTVYNQYIWAIQELGLYDKFKATISPMEIVFKKTGQKIMFFGTDDPGKIKSLKVPFGYVGVVHFEELDQFSGQEEIRNIEQSLLRGGDLFYCFKSFNPPITNSNWANKYALEKKPGVLVHHSTYKTTPIHWLGPKFVADAEYLKETNPRAYEHEYLGVPIGTGGSVFENVETRPIVDTEFQRFDKIYMGVDWGWYPDPFAFVRLHYDRAHETIYFLDELYLNKQPNETTGQKIKDKGYLDAYITCDSAEPKSVNDFRSMGLPAKEAIKGPGSVDYGMKWLQRRKLIIDPRRTPNAAREFTEYEYERDKNNEIISGYPDKDNHIIDATRYALERIMGKRGVRA